MAFYGIGQNYLKKATGADKKIAYDVDTTILGSLEVRPGYEKYGANAFFDENKNLLEIYVSSLGKTVKPEDGEWKHAKWVWRTSLVFIVTAGTHLAQVIIRVIRGVGTRGAGGAPPPPPLMKINQNC